MSQIERGSGVITIYYNDFCFVDWKEICEAMNVYPHDTQSLEIHARTVVKIGGKLLDGEDQLLEYNEEKQKKYVDYHQNRIKENTTKKITAD